MYSNAQHQQNYSGGRENPPLNNININPGYAQQLQHQHQLQNNMSSSRSHINRSVVDLHPNVLIFLDSIIDRVNFTHKNQSESGGIVALLMGTIDGVGLVRAFGTSNTVDAGLSEIELSIIESVWATFPSGTGHHLRSLGLGQDCKMITTFYENSTLVHFHMSPLVRCFFILIIHSFIHLTSI